MNRLFSSSLTVLATGLAAPALAANGTIVVEMPKVDATPYRKPYIAAWLEDSSGKAVKVITVFHDQARIGARWLPELRSWWRAAGRAMTMPADGISRPTQAPGRQTFSVNGLAPGRYQLVVEAAREKGGREVVKVPFEVRQRAGATASGRGNSEVGRVSISVRP